MEIVESKDYYGLYEMFQKNGLEVNPQQNKPEGNIKCWEIRLKNELVAGIALENRAGEFVVGGLSVEKPFRNRGYGIMLMKKAEEEAKILGGKRIMLVAKVPGFYKSNGYISIPRMSAPKISKCMDCNQFNSSCFPEVMYKKIEK